MLTFPPFIVTDTEFEACRPCPGSPEYRAMREWLSALVRDDWPDDMLYVRGPCLFPIGFGPCVTRDATTRRVTYLYVNTRPGTARPEDCVSTGVVQLEAAPPPWPPEIAAYVSQNT
jgi:hypothetical protein